MNYIELIPDASALIEATRSIGYTIESAVADIIDNSISANATNIWIDFSVLSNKPYLSITDDGNGMKKEELINAMKYGSFDPSFNRNNSDLGRFGLGLKTASMSQCRKLSVFSKISKETYALSWDLDYVRSSSKWNVLEMNDQYLTDRFIGNKFLSINTGTLVLWEDLDRLSENASEKIEEIVNKKMNLVRDHLSLVFHRFLSSNSGGVPKLTIYLNNLKIEPHDPFFIKKSRKIMEDEKMEISYLDNFGLKKKATVVVIPFILPHPNKMSTQEKEMYGDTLKRDQGFYIYRNKRLIVWGTWFRLIKMDDSFKLARVMVDIPNSLDTMWSLDIKKSMASPPFVLRDLFRKIIENVAGQSKKTYIHKKNLETKDNLIHIWNRIEKNDGIEYLLNQEHPLLSKLKDNLSSQNLELLNLIIKITENSIPLTTLFLDYNSDQKNIKNIIEDKEFELKEFAKKYLLMCKNSNEVEQAVKILNSFDIFSEHKELILEVKEEVNYEFE